MAIIDFITGPWLWPLLILAFAAFFVYNVLKRGSQMHVLARRGVNGTANIIDKYRHNDGDSMDTFYLRYRYRAPDGETYEHKSAVSREEFAAFNVGDVYDIVYVPDQPHILAPRNVVEQSRQAMAKSN